MSDKHRLISLDILRGFIIILMALDHTRHYWAITPFMPTDIENTTPAWFFTRWVTHFCAPLFVFLTGISAYLYGEKVQSKLQLRNYLLSRGLWLVFLELTGISFSWQFAFDIVFLQVIWVIGLSMIILAGLIYLPLSWISVLAITVIDCHNLIDDDHFLAVLGPQFSWLWHLLHVPTAANLTAEWQLFIVYPLMPWFAVMALGYCIAPIFKRDSTFRCKTFLSIGLISIALFVLLKITNFYGDPKPFVEYTSNIKTFMSLLNNTKYPPSLLYLLMTIGPGLILLALLERLTQVAPTRPWLAWLQVFGGVPLFYYLIHIPVINLSAQIYAILQYGRTVQFLDSADNWPALYQPNLWLAYSMWIVLTILLYLPCKHYMVTKRTSQHLLLKYL
ncbi:DUF1624 domain-containing protein [Pseudoalteromonas luteoviolacea]|uniref:Heparan-alpha-glucosaminide N-acetyltransferase catalytic domain-containing protein n=1 Tax=Pseudoalteromonas luteoviolacea DSM 6061 TaxID=1365250 RepID=A0A166V7X9_9GAMM|nr:heparan-alpha-glucosaminide N-acetyltransferase domain-containing protein [Pseudoalteromonas luteoviolacea]KZN31816.1 hypothetical protein N475_22790 [Pseudoalteromonas luteoviolacea DSM 6061]MBE0389744.1 hypothetical protein [Pseudoalteromonas luteoviolacea DSM 6061]